MEAGNQRNWAVVTGASKGLGRAIALELAGRGYSLVLVARSQSLLDELANHVGSVWKVEAIPFAADMTHPSAADDLHGFCLERQIRPSVLVNNAGIGVYDRFHISTREEYMRMNTLNVDAVLHTTYALLPLLLEQRKAFIMNVGSTAAFQPVPFMALYAAGKAYVRSFSYALRHELKGGPVSVTCLSPGGVWTDFMAAAGSEAVSEKNKRFMMTAERCAQIAVSGMLRGKTEVIPGWHNAFAAFITRFAPTSMTTKMAGRIFSKD